MSSPTHQQRFSRHSKDEIMEFGVRIAEGNKMAAARREIREASKKDRKFTSEYLAKEKVRMHYDALDVWNRTRYGLSVSPDKLRFAYGTRWMSPGDVAPLRIYEKELPKIADEGFIRIYFTICSPKEKSFSKVVARGNVAKRVMCEDRQHSLDIYGVTPAFLTSEDLRGLVKTKMFTIITDETSIQHCRALTKHFERTWAICR